MPGSSALMRYSVSASSTSICGQSPRPPHKAGTSKPRKTSSNSRFISRCRVNIGCSLAAGTAGRFLSALRFQGTRSRTFMIILLSSTCVRTGAERDRRWLKNGASGHAAFGFGLFDLGDWGRRSCPGRDFDAAGPQRLRNLADQVDRQKAVGEVGRLDDDIIGELEAALEV